MTNEEIWKPLPGFEGLYEVSNKGQIVRLKDKSGRAIRKVLKPSLNRPNGYLNCAPCKDGKQMSTHVHTLVALAFIGPRPPGSQVDHINGDKSDNRPENLEYVSAQENTQRFYKRTGRTKPDRALTKEQVLAIRADFGDVMDRLDECAAKHGITYQMLTHVLRRVSWRHI